MQPTLFSIRDAAEVLGVEPARVQRWVRSGIIAPSERRGRQRLLTFKDLIAAKAAKELLDRGVPERAVKRNLAALHATLPAIDRPLSRLRVVSDGEQLVVVGDDVAFEATSGQVVMEFVVGSLSTRAAEVLALPRTAPTEPPEERAASSVSTAWALFIEGLTLEQFGRHQEAEASFCRALERDPQLAAAHTNLGRLAFVAGRRGEARSHFEQALAIDADQPEARYNLGVLLEALGEGDKARAEWSRVAALSPEFADAHYNLGVALARQGATLAARASLERYLSLDAHGPWADAARALGDELARHAP